MNATLKWNRRLLCVTLAALSAVAGATVNKCVDGNGEVLFTDAVCPDGSRLVDPEVSDGPGVGVVMTSSGVERVPAGVEHVAAGAAGWSAPAPRSRWADLPHPLPRKAISLDASTLQTARMNMHLQDELRHQQRVAGR